ncbi:aldehyde dehydrogenase family protein [Shewanella psychropiezotolerans]|uniref:Aldehyde dehydrogenase family protein n=1 Tax=Shewanella psychropiezotolerans TaxID=2593655 RepID=A0ABX5WVW4_9GAMM|nr:MULTISPECIES: aldehyde dehydrogenase family protein [Shewanella]MPY22459.1 aldehyde dehydrogenase family protein [Shewanella sp. YLB-07]QDO83228.1 aldehyde dehydrogenase family protein [Shewanella psychropiezotolerans]
MSPLSLSILNDVPVSDTVQRYLSTDLKMCIGGQWLSASSGETIDVFEPSSGELLAKIPAADKQDIDKAVISAQAGFKVWSRMLPYERQQVILKFADLIECHADDFAMLESLDNGKSVEIARHVDVESTIKFFRYMAGWATKIEGTTQTVSVPGLHSTYTKKVPIGVVGAIVPWNFPLSMAAWKIAPALATGCSIILKPAENTSLTALLLAEIGIKAGLPAGVLNVVTGFGNVAGAALSSHPGINKIAFTGSTPVGKMIGKAAMENVTRVSLELGGKSPVIVFNDADIEKAAQGAASAIFFNHGQVCVAGSRLYVQSGIYEAFIQRVSEIANDMTLTHGMDSQIDMGPLISRVQQERVQDFIKIGIEEGARLLAGGCDWQGPGYFVKPTVFADTHHDMTIVREEIFGPVLVAQSFDTLEEVIALANDTPFGLAASIWSNDIKLVHQMIDSLEVGIVWVNTHHLVDASMPFGGVKQSGFGREQGKEQLDLFLETKTVWINYGD